jgi:hypothetical protein
MLGFFVCSFDRTIKTKNMKKIACLLLLSLSIFSIYSCSDEEGVISTSGITMNPQSIYSVLEITNSPDGTFTFSVLGDYTNIQVTSGNFEYTSDTWEQSQVSGLTLGYSISLIFSPDYDIYGYALLGCADIVVKTYNNNNLINTENFQIGYSQYSPDVIFCDNLVANNHFSKHLSIVAE